MRESSAFGVQLCEESTTSQRGDLLAMCTIRLSQQVLGTNNLVDPQDAE